MRNNRWKFIFIFSLVIGGGLSLFASSSPDGLERVAQMQGFFGNSTQFFPSFLSNYQIPGIHSGALATSFSGIIGVSVVFLFLFFVGKILYRSDGVKNLNN